jgi:hypothetical protein
MDMTKSRRRGAGLVELLAATAGSFVSEIANTAGAGGRVLAAGESTRV